MKIVFALLAILTTALLLAGGYLYYVTSHAPANAAASTTFNRPFTLTGHTGAAITNATFLGKPSLYFFGFTHCPDVCPTTLGALTTWLNALGPDASKLNVTFISIDPERDTPEKLAAYLKSFHPQIRAATGTGPQLREMAKIFMVYYAKVEPKPDEDPAGYMMSHSSGILMADGNGTFKGMLDAHDADADALARLKALIAE